LVTPAHEGVKKMFVTFIDSKLWFGVELLVMMMLAVSVWPTLIGP
jgi:hypothetical protein